MKLSSYMRSFPNEGELCVSINSFLGKYEHGNKMKCKEEEEQHTEYEIVG